MTATKERRGCSPLSRPLACRLLIGALLLAAAACASSTRGVRVEQPRHRDERQLLAFNRMKRERRVALVVGNGAYSHIGSLKNPPNDAQLMGRTLRSLGFAVTVVTDADQKQMTRSVEEFERRLAEADVGLFYFAGHGVQRGGRNYLVPTAPAIHSAQEFDDRALGLDALMGAMRRAGPRMNIVILDACRNDPFPRSERSATQGLGEPENAVGTVIAYAAARGRIAKDGTGDHSPYTEALTRHMRRPNVEIGTMLRGVFAAVRDATDGSQQPWYEVAVDGQFYFNLGDAPPDDLLPAPRSRRGTWVAGGLSAVGFAGGLAFGAQALSKEDELAAACGQQDPCPTKHRALEENRNLYRSLALISTGVGIGGLAALLWFLTQANETPADDRPQAPVAITSSLSFDSTGRPHVGIAGQFW
ncbi:MAG: caspase family protein [Myxococcales bacterium]|nr:caspase family protein [Myxococcales bacterium]MDD9968584.1 caspase family protein [Myxococcales bacterium]